MHYIRPCIFGTTQVNSIMLTSETTMLYKNNGFLDSAEEQIGEGDIELVKLVVHEVSLCPQVKLIF